MGTILSTKITQDFTEKKVTKWMSCRSNLWSSLSIYSHFLNNTIFIFYWFYSNAAICGTVKWSIYNINTHIYTIPWRQIRFAWIFFFTLKQSLKLKNRVRVWFSARVLSSYIHRALSWLLSLRETQINNLQFKGSKTKWKESYLLASLVLCLTCCAKDRKPPLYGAFIPKPN